MELSHSAPSGGKTYYCYYCTYILSSTTAPQRKHENKSSTMSLTITKAEGVTVFTVTSNPKSKWPLFFQILGTLCCSSTPSVSLEHKQKLKHAYSALGTVQIMIGLINLGFGGTIASFYAGYSFLQYIDAPFWLGALFIIFGIICIIAEKFPSPCLVAMTVMMNIASGALAITAIVLYSIDLAQMEYLYYCHDPQDRYNSYNWELTSSSEGILKKQEDYRMCQKYRDTMRSVRGGLDILMIILSVLQLCIIISWCVLSIKALCKKKENEENVEDPEHLKPLIKEELSDSAN